MSFRRGEIAGLEWKDFNLKKGTLKINREYITVAGLGTYTDTPKSVAGCRENHMPPSLQILLAEYKEWWDEYVKKLGKKYDGSGRLFLQVTGKPMYPSTINYWLEKLQDKYDMPKVALRSLRTTSITSQLNSHEIDDLTLAKRNGHDDISVAKKHYHKKFDKNDKRAAEAVDTIFKRIRMRAQARAK